MIPADFPESNRVLVGGPDRPEVMDLPCFTGNGITASFWKMSFEELRQVIDTGGVWFSVHGTNHPPIRLSVDRPPEFPVPSTDDPALGVK